MPLEIKIINNKKKCSKCGKEKPVEDFHKSCGTKSGLMSQCKECRKKSYYQNKKDILSKRRKYYSEHREEICKWKREYYRKNINKIKKYMKKHAEKIRLEVLQHYGGNPPKCACCGESHTEFLTIDHIRGGGNKHRKEIFGKSVGGRLFYYWLRKNNYPEGYQVLCHNCNFAKSHYNGGCPHKREKK